MFRLQLGLSAVRGPPTYFCGHWTFFVTWKGNLINFIKTNLDKKNSTYFLSTTIKKINFYCFAEIVTSFKNCGPICKKNNLQIYPAIKKV